VEPNGLFPGSSMTRLLLPCLRTLCPTNALYCKFARNPSKWLLIKPRYPQRPAQDDHWL
jgi:hypothetical protein